MTDLRIIKFGLVVVLVLGLAPLSFAQENKKEEITKKTTAKEISGEVSGISSNFIAIVYGQNSKTSFEMALIIDKDTKVEHKKSLKEIKPGDTVSVRYEENTETYKEETKKGEKKDVTRLLRRIVKTVDFVRAAPKELQSS
jgi:preprotein translocase subunit YajC